MDKIKTVKIKNEDGSISEESYTISVDARNVDMDNGKDLQDTIGNINVDIDGNIAEQLKDLNDNIGILNIDIKKKVYYFNAVADMKNANLKIGDMAVTLGYYEPNDGGGAEYNIIEDNGYDANKYYEELNNNLLAELIMDKNIFPEMFGAYGDGLADDTIAVNKAFSFSKKNIFLNKDYLLTTDISINSDTIISGKGKLILTGGVGALTASGYIHADSKENIILQGVTIDNQCTTLTNDKTITFKDCSNIIVNNCKILNEGTRTGWTLVFWNCSYSKIINNYIKGSNTYQLDDGIHVTGHDLIIQNNYVETIDDAIAVGYNSSSSVGGIQPIVSTTSYNIIIDNNTIKSTEAGIHLYTYDNETSINNINITNNMVSGRLIIRDDVSSITTTTIKNILIDSCNINNEIHSGNSPLVAFGNNKNLVISNSIFNGTKGVGVFVLERDGEDITIDNCNIYYSQTSNYQYRAIVNLGVLTSSNCDVICKNSNIKTNCRLGQGYFKSFVFENNNCDYINDGTILPQSFLIQGVDYNGVKIINNNIITNASTILSVGNLLDKLFIFAFNSTNVANPTYEVGATNFHTDYNIIY